MKLVAATALCAALALGIQASYLRQPIYEGKVESDQNFATSAQSTKPARAPGYRNAWDDCGGIGASATERMRTIASKIKGWAKPLPFVRHAAQDCGSLDPAGTQPGPGSQVNYPGPEIPAAARAGLAKAAKTLEKYPAAVKEKAKDVSYRLALVSQPLYEGKVESDQNFATSAQSTKPARAPGYRNAWDDCGGIGASATERMRTIASKIKGWAKPLPFVRHAGQDCGSLDPAGTQPGPGSQVNYPGPEVAAAARAGLAKAAKTLEKYPAAVKEKAKDVSYRLAFVSQPLYEGKVESDQNFATSAQSTKPARAPGYRNAWDDCGGVGASATERMRTIASKIKGWAKPLPFVRHAGQDCGSLDPAGTQPGPGSQVNYPGPEVAAAARAGLAKAAKTLEKYPAAEKEKAKDVSYRLALLSQPLYEGKVESDQNFATSAQSTKPARAPGYRNAWDDCGGIGASATERMRTIASKIKGWAKPLPFVRHAAQDCGSLDPAGTQPGPGSQVNYPGPEIPAAARAGLAKAAETLEKYPAVVKEKAKDVSYRIA